MQELTASALLLCEQTAQSLLRTFSEQTSLTELLCEAAALCFYAYPARFDSPKAVLDTLSVSDLAVFFEDYTARFLSEQGQNPNFPKEAT